MEGLGLEPKREKEEKGGGHRPFQGIPRGISEPRLPLAEGQDRARHRRRLLGQLRPMRVLVRRHQERLEARPQIQENEQGEGIPEPIDGRSCHNEVHGGRRQRHGGVLGRREVLGAHALRGPLQQLDRLLRDKPGERRPEYLYGWSQEALGKEKGIRGPGHDPPLRPRRRVLLEKLQRALADIRYHKIDVEGGTPTDNGAMEAINGWLKDELFSDFSINGSEDVEESVRAYVEYFNERRPAFALGYLTPKQFTERFYGSRDGAREEGAAAVAE